MQCESTKYKTALSNTLLACFGRHFVYHSVHCHSIHLRVLLIFSFHCREHSVLQVFNHYIGYSMIYSTMGRMLLYTVTILVFWYSKHCLRRQNTPLNNFTVGNGNSTSRHIVSSVINTVLRRICSRYVSSLYST